MSAPMNDGPPGAPQAAPTGMPVPQKQPAMPTLPNPPGVSPMGPVTGENTAAVPVTIDQVMQLLRDDDMRGYRIEIETDQLVQADEDAEKARAIEFMGAVGQFLTAFGPMVMQMPPLAKMASQMLVFSVRRFKTGRELEDVIEQTMDQISERLGNPPPPQPDPKTMAEIEKMKIEAAARIQEMQGDMQIQREKHAADLQMSQQEHEFKLAELQTQHQVAMQKHQMDMQKMQAEMERAAIEDQRQEALHERTLQQSDMQHRQKLQIAQETHSLSKAEREHQASLAERQTAAKEKATVEKDKPAGKRKYKAVRGSDGRISGLEEV